MCLILTAKILIINDLHKDPVVKLHKTEDFWVHKLHKMDCFLIPKLHKMEVFSRDSINNIRL